MAVQYRYKLLSIQRYFNIGIRYISNSHAAIAAAAAAAVLLGGRRFLFLANNFKVARLN